MKVRASFLIALCSTAILASGQTMLPQNWTAARRQQVYTTAQGSKLIPYAWALALERADDETLFFADNGHRFGFLPNGSATGLPIGLVEDRNLDGTSHLGLTCAACHTRDVHFKGTTYRIDGGGGDPDLYAFLAELGRATTATAKSAGDPKFVRFAKRVLGENDGPRARRKLFDQLKAFATGYATFLANSTPSTAWGRSRTDAFGMIFNRVTSIDLGIPSNSRKPDAPVSYPFLWDTSWFDKVQYDASVPNTSVVERLGRNVGEVLGVFAEVKVNRILGKPVMRSTAKRVNLLALEDWWEELRAPKWSDATALPPIDTTKLARGQQVYNDNCLSCHAMVTPGARQKVTIVSLEKAGTDPAMTTAAVTRRAKTGLLEGVRKNLILLGPKFGPVDTAGAVTGHVGIAVILTPEVSPSNPSPNGANDVSEEQSAPAVDSAAVAAEVAAAPPPEPHNDRDDAERAHVRALLESPNLIADVELTTQLRAFAVNEEARLGLQYRARPLDGIWATAPYLHNGSVPTLADLLKPPAERPATFFVGDCEIDPVNVGCDTSQQPGAFLFDTTKPGNHNTGHEHGTTLSPEDRAALLEYLKSL